MLIFLRGQNVSFDNCVQDIPLKVKLKGVKICPKKFQFASTNQEILRSIPNFARMYVRVSVIFRNSAENA